MNRYERKQFKQSLTDGFFWYRVKQKILRKSCSWYGCALCMNHLAEYEVEEYEKMQEL